MAVRPRQIGLRLSLLLEFENLVATSAGFGVNINRRRRTFETPRLLQDNSVGIHQLCMYSRPGRCPLRVMRDVVGPKSPSLNEIYRRRRLRSASGGRRGALSSDQCIGSLRNWLCHETLVVEAAWPKLIWSGPCRPSNPCSNSPKHT